MAVKMRLTRIGRRHRPFFRINVVEGRTPRDGRVIEKLGYYDPLEKDPAKQIVLNRERAEYWLSQGATPSDTVSQMLLKQGIKHKYAEDQAKKSAKARSIARKKGIFFTKAEKIAAEKAVTEAQEKAKADAEAAKKAAEEKAKADEAAKKAAEEEKPAVEEAEVPAEPEVAAEVKEEAKEQAVTEAEVAEEKPAEKETKEEESA